ncbi:MAG TPA: HEAT repeat domain-containing protein, partial [Thermoanaerobaculia bacterium]|nr:HEAT repeat domain-containing protein [Thermoanaerobaculia bacterium]
MRSARRLRGPAALVSLVLSLTACASSPAPRREPTTGGRPEPAVASRSEHEARALLLLLADRRLYDPTALQLMLAETPPVRRDLARTLGRLGDPRGRSLLQGLLVDSDLEVRREAAFALGELGDAEARRALVVAAVDPDPELGGLAVEALGKLGTPLDEVRRPLSALGEVESLRRLAPFLFRFREAEAVEVAARGLASTEAAVRRGAAYALGREPRPEGVDLLRGVLDDEDPFVRAWVARGLGGVGDLGDLERLESRLGDPESSPLVQALRAGAEILGRSPALPPLGWGDRIVALLDDARPGVRAAALEAAAAFLPHPALEAAVESRLATGEPRERELALLALAAADVETAAGAVAGAASAPDPRTRAVAAEAAARRGDVDTLFRLTEDSDASVRRAALEGLGRGAGDATAELAGRFLLDPDPTVRATALEMLAEQPGVPARLLAEALDRAREDPMNDARLAGV